MAFEIRLRKPTPWSLTIASWTLKQSIETMESWLDGIGSYCICVPQQDVEGGVLSLVIARGLPLPLPIVSFIYLCF
jgi:hypothetical protein